MIKAKQDHFSYNTRNPGKGFHPGVFRLSLLLGENLAIYENGPMLFNRRAQEGAAEAEPEVEEMYGLLLTILTVLSTGYFRGDPGYPEPRYDGSVGSIWLDRFLAAGGMDYRSFLMEMDQFDPWMERGWGYRPSSWRWIPRMTEWERMIPEIEGMGYLLSRLDLDREQHYYLDALTAYVDFNLSRLRGTGGVDRSRRQFFEAFTGDSFSPSSVAMIFEGGGFSDHETRDMIGWALGEIRSMLTYGQMEEAARLTSLYGGRFRTWRY